MPTYEYRCATGHTFERFEKMSAEPATTCPECGAEALRVISGGAGLVFKGSGFYITDYGKDGKGPAKDAKTTKPSGKDPAPKSDGGASAKDGGSPAPSTKSDTPSSSASD
jgi:putative FmdB family regulatory protein